MAGVALRGGGLLLRSRRSSILASPAAAFSCASSSSLAACCTGLAESGFRYWPLRPSALSNKSPMRSFVDVEGRYESGAPRRPPRGGLRERRRGGGDGERGRAVAREPQLLTPGAEDAGGLRGGERKLSRPPNGLGLPCRRASSRARAFSRGEMASGGEMDRRRRAR